MSSRQRSPPAAAARSVGSPGTGSEPSAGRGAIEHVHHTLAGTAVERAGLAAAGLAAPAAERLGGARIGDPQPRHCPGSPYKPGEKVVALTFDDGPSPVYTPQILRILVAARAPASFEITGLHGGAYPGIVRTENADGMALVNHTWTHIDLAALPAWRWPAEVDRTSRLLRGVTGHPVRCVRPPYGLGDRAVDAQLRGRGLAELDWDVDPSDYLRPGAVVIARRVLAALRPGAIVIMHDGGGNRSQTVAALPAIIRGIRAAGYQIVPVCAADQTGNQAQPGSCERAPTGDPRAICGVPAARFHPRPVPPCLAAARPIWPAKPASNTTISSSSPRRTVRAGKSGSIAAEHMTAQIHVDGRVAQGRLAAFAEGLERYLGYARHHGYTLPRVLQGLSGSMNSIRLVTPTMTSPPIRNSRRVRPLAASVLPSRWGLVQGLRGHPLRRRVAVTFLHSP